MSINFVQARNEESPKLAAYRRLVVSVTTGILVMYIVGVAGFLGWYSYLGQKEERTSSDVEMLVKKIGAKSEEEVVARKLAARTEDVRQFLDTRVNSTRQAQVIRDGQLMPVGWEINAGQSKQSIKVRGNSVDELSKFVEYMKEKYLNVGMGSASWDESYGWQVEVSYSLEKPE